MAKIKLKKSLQVVLENSKHALIKVINESMLLQDPTEDEISWLLLEFTLEYPFPPTLGLAQKAETERLTGEDEHPLIAYNSPDLELFSEDQTIVVDFHSYDELFSTVDQLLEEIEYEDRQPFIFQLYVDVCKALMLESSNWKHLKLSNDFHVTARDYEICDEAEYLKKLLPKKSFNKIKRKIDVYDAKMNDTYANDETVLKVKSVVDVESDRYEELLKTVSLEDYSDVFTQDEIYFIRPFFVETQMHKRPYEIDRELSTQNPTKETRYYHYKFRNNIPQIVDFYSDDKIIWRKIFQHQDGFRTAHKFFLKSGSPEFEDYVILKELTTTLVYEKYSDGRYDEIIYHRNTQGQIAHALHLRSICNVGYKMDTTFEYLFEYKHDDLFKISCINQNNKKSISYCKDDSFMDEAIDDFVEHICRFTIAKMKEQSLENLDAVVLVYDVTLAFYFTIHLFRNKEMIDISTYELHEDDSSMMNLTVYTSESASSPDHEYFSREQSEEYVNETYTRICEALEQRIVGTFQLSVPVVIKYIYDDLDL